MTVSISPASVEERNALFRRHIQPLIPRLRGTVRSHTLPGDDPDDALQDLLIHLLQVLPALHPTIRQRPDRFEPWLATVVRNFLHDRQRHQQHLATLWGDAAGAPEAEGEEIPDPVLVPCDASQGFAEASLPSDPSHLVALLPPDHAAAIAALPAHQRIVLRLSVEGYDPAEIAHLLGISVPAVNTRLHRARTAIRAHLAHRAAHPLPIITAAPQPGRKEALC